MFFVFGGFLIFLGYVLGGIFCADDYRFSNCGAAYEAGADGIAAVWACYAGNRRLGMTCGDLLVPSPLVFEPTRRMPPGWITMRPVDDSALRVGLILAVKRHSVSLS